MKIKELSIEGFSPNCLMGVTGSVAKYKYDTMNINSLYFHHSYVYEKKESVLYDGETNGLNVWFSRELPITKEDFCSRLYQYYGLVHKYKTYSDFREFISDLNRMTKKDEPVMVEIDFYFMKKHRFYHKVHDQHMMVIYDVNYAKQCLMVCEAVFGHFEFSFSDYEDYFNEVVNNRKRKVFSLILTKDKTKEVGKTKINLQNFIDDVNKSLNNLAHNNGKAMGLGALKEFYKDFMKFIKNRDEEINNFFVPGLWVFMCDAMNCVNFINEFQNDYPQFPKENLAEIKKCSTVINRKWYYITMAINEVNRYKIADYEKAFLDILKAEEILIDRLRLLKQELIHCL